MNLEEISTVYFDEDAIRLPSYKLGRVAFEGGRLYYRYGYNEPEGVELFNSLTTVIYQCTPMPFSLLEWYCKLGLTEAKRYSNMKAMYGTLMHKEIGKFCEQQEYDFDLCKSVVEDYLSENDFWQPECKTWEYELKEDMMAWCDFAYQTNLKCIAIEMVLASSKGFATAIDVVCDMDFQEKGYWVEVYKSGDKKGEPKLTVQPVRKRALINMKSGRHGFYENNGLQVFAEKQLFEENFPDIKIDACLNWHPSNWQKADSDKYKIKDWTNLVEEKEIDCMFELAEVKFRDKMQSKERIQIWGKVSNGNDPRKNISVDLLSDMIRRKEIAKINPDIPSI